MNAIRPSMLAGMVLVLNGVCPTSAQEAEAVVSKETSTHAALTRHQSTLEAFARTNRLIPNGPNFQPLSLILQDQRALDEHRSPANNHAASTLIHLALTAINSQPEVTPRPFLNPHTSLRPAVPYSGATYTPVSRCIPVTSSGSSLGTLRRFGGWLAALFGFGAYRATRMRKAPHPVQLRDTTETIMNDVSTSAPKPRVLLVSSHSSWTDLVARNIQTEFEVVQAHLPEEALEILSTESFNVVTVELIIPQMSGIEMVEEMHRRNIWTPAIITTAAFRRDQVDDIPAMTGITAWLVHPCTREEILKALHAAVTQGPRPEPSH